MNIVYINSVNSPYVLDLSNVQTGLMNTQEVRLLADTTGSAISIYLPAISAFPAQNVKIYVTDYLGNAANNNITVYAYSGNTINGASSAIVSTDNGFIKLEIGSTNEWVSVSQGTNGGGGISAIQEFSVTISPARAIAMFNDTSLFEVAIPALPANKLIQVLGVTLIIGVGSIDYDGSFPRLFVGYFNVNKSSALFSSSERNIWGAASGKAAFMTPNIDSSGTGGLVAFGLPLKIYSGDDYNTTVGDHPITIIGTYLVIDIP